MDQFEILEIFESYTVKLSEVERELGMPAKFLSRYKNPKYKLPEKWIKPLTEVAERVKIGQPPFAPKIDEENRKSEPEADKDDLGDQFRSLCKLKKCDPQDMLIWIEENYGKKQVVEQKKELIPAHKPDSTKEEKFEQPPAEASKSERLKFFRQRSAAKV